MTSHARRLESPFRVRSTGGDLSSSDLGRAKAFTESQDLREAMTKAGVVDRPDIYFLTS